MAIVRPLGLPALGLLLAVAACAAADCEASEDYGSRVASGDSELGTDFAAADDSEGADFTVVRYDPDDEVTADEVYYLRFLETADDDQVQQADLNLRTGQWVESGDDDLDFSANDIDDAFDSALEAIAYEDGGDLLWYFDVDDSGDLTRHDLRLVTFEIDGDDYAAGSYVRLSDNDYGLFRDASPDETASLNGGDLAWFDDDGDDEVSPGDCILFQPDGFDADAAVGDIRLTGAAPDGPDDPTDEPTDDTPTEETPNEAPGATLTASVSGGHAPLAVTFTIRATDPEGDDLTWELDADGDGAADEAGTDDDLPATFAFTFAAAGTYEATLTVSDGAADASDSVTVTVQPAREDPTPPPTDDGTEEEGNGGDNGVPGPGFVAVAAALAAAAAALRRRQA